MGSIIYNGHEIQDLIVNGNKAQLWLNGHKLYPSAPVDPYNPLGLPPFTIRCKFSSGYTPDMGDSQTLVDAGENVWDITNNSTVWSGLLRGVSDLLEILGANSTGVTDMSQMFERNRALTSVQLFDTRSCTDMSYMFSYCSSLTTVPLFDTSSCTDMNSMFYECTSLATVPLFDTHSCTNMSAMFGYCTSLATVPLFDTHSCTNMSAMFDSCESLTTVPLFDTSSCRAMDGMFSYCSSLTTVPLFNTSSCTKMLFMFRNCTKVESGALALYQQASTQATVPSHDNTFKNCGRDTVTGAAELAQIPSDWK